MRPSFCCDWVGRSRAVPAKSTTNPFLRPMRTLTCSSYPRNFEVMKLMKLRLSGKRRAHDVWFAQRWRFATSPVSKLILLTVLFYMVRLNVSRMSIKGYDRFLIFPERKPLMWYAFYFMPPNISDTLHECAIF